MSGSSSQIAPGTNRQTLRKDIRRQGQFIPPTLLQTLIMWSSPKQKETSELAHLCKIISNHLSDRSLFPQQSKYDDFKRPVCGLPSNLFSTDMD